MRKNLFSPLLPILALALGLNACSPAKTEKTEYTHVIPANAKEVVAFNLKGLTVKAGLDSDENRLLQQKLIATLLENNTTGFQQQMEVFLDNPAETGIDWDAPAYLFRSPSLRCPTLSLKIKDLKKFESAIDVFVKEHLCTSPAEVDGYRTTEIQGTGIQLAYNDGTLLGIYATGTEQLRKLQPAITALMKQTAEQSIHTNKHFSPMMKQKGDIRLLATPDDLPLDVRGVLNWPSGTPLIGFALFENGRIYASLQRADFDGDTQEGNQPFHPQNARELQQAMLLMMQGRPFNISLTSEELLTLSNLRALMGFASDSPEVNALYRLIMEVEELNLRGDSNRTRFTLVLKKQNENALKQLTDFAKQFIGN